MRLAARLRLGHWLDVEHRPTLFLSLILSGFVYAGASGGALLLEKDETGLSTLDALVCQTFKGDICLRMIAIADSEETQFLLQVNACEGGVTATCLSDGRAKYQVEPARAATLWRAACAGGTLKAASISGFSTETALALRRMRGARQSFTRRVARGAMRGAAAISGFSTKTALALRRMRGGPPIFIARPAPGMTPWAVTISAGISATASVCRRTPARR